MTEKILRHGIKITKVGNVFVVTATIKVETGWKDNKNSKPILFRSWPNVEDYIRDNFYRGEVSIKNEANDRFIRLAKDPMFKL